MNNIVNFNSNIFVGNYLASRAICLMPAIEMAILTIQDLGNLIDSFSKENQADPLLIPNKEVALQQEKDRKAERWKKISMLSQDALGALFFGFCAIHPIPEVALAGSVAFFVYSKFCWKNPAANRTTAMAGLSVSLLTKALVKVIKVVGLKVLQLIQLIAQKIFEGAQRVGKELKEAAQAVIKISKSILYFPVKLIKSPIKTIGKISSKSFSFLKAGGKASLKVAALVAKFFGKGASALFSHPKVGLALIGACLGGVIAFKGVTVLSQLNLMVVMQGVVAIGSAVVPTIASVAQAVFLQIFSAAAVVGPLLLNATIAVVPAALQVTGMVAGQILQLFLKIIF